MMELPTMELRTMVRMSTTKHVMAMVGLLAGLAIGGAALAQTNAPGAPTHGDSDMMGHGTADSQDGKTSGMMNNSETQPKIGSMIDRCDRMMDGGGMSGAGAPAGKS
jgi:hypothetical protein